jgi:hypothetical protein
MAAGSKMPNPASAPQARKVKADVLTNFLASESGKHATEVWSNRMTAGGDVREATIASISRTAKDNQEQSFLWQSVFRSASPHDKLALARGLRSHVGECSTSPHAVWVVREVIDHFSPDGEAPNEEVTAFIIDELCEFAGAVAENMFGSRLVCKLIEKMWKLSGTNIETLVANILQDLRDVNLELVNQNHGAAHHVLGHIIEFGNRAHKCMAVSLLLGHCIALMTHKQGSATLERALRHCEFRDSKPIYDEICKDERTVLDLCDFDKRRMKRDSRYYVLKTIKEYQTHHEQNLKWCPTAEVFQQLFAVKNTFYAFKDHGEDNGLRRTRTT